MKYIQKLNLSSLPMDPLTNKMKPCVFCKNKHNPCDYKNLQVMRSFISDSGRILPFRLSGLCKTHQKKLKKQVERCRFLALVSCHKVIQ